MSEDCPARDFLLSLIIGAPSSENTQYYILLKAKYMCVCIFIKTAVLLSNKLANVYEAVSDQGPVWVHSEDKIPRASKSNFEVEILISLVSLLP